MPGRAENMLVNAPHAYPYYCCCCCCCCYYVAVPGCEVHVDELCTRHAIDAQKQSDKLRLSLSCAPSTA
jgi:hypothetical protein